MAEAGRPDPPKALGAEGRRFHRAIIRDLEDGWGLDAREINFLAEAAFTADAIAELQAVVDRDGVLSIGSTGQRVVHPAVAEIRQQRITQLRLLNEIELSDPAKARLREPPTSRRARDAAASRWGKAARLASVTS